METSPDAPRPRPGTAADRRPPLLVSSCLLGVACTHKGEAKPSPAVQALAADWRLIPVCPEVAGGLGTPRPAAERTTDGRVVTAAGDDVSDFYRRGAEHAVALALATGARRAVLKARSPSCGSGRIYDGSHTGVLVDGDGTTTSALRAAGLDVVSEEGL